MCTSDIIGAVGLKYPAIKHYADAVAEMYGRKGRYLTGFMMVGFLGFLTSGHVLTGATAFDIIFGNGKTCTLIFASVSTVLLFGCSMLRSFHSFSWLGWIDLFSAVLAIGVTITSLGIEASNAPGGMTAVDWSWWPREDVTFPELFNAVAIIVFAYSFSVCQFSVMSQMERPADYRKAICTLTAVEMFVYTLTGVLTYRFGGSKVRSIALLSMENVTWVKVALGVAIPVILISGAINAIVLGQYIQDQMVPETSRLRAPGWQSTAFWIVLVSIINALAFVLANVIPFFSGLLGIISSVFVPFFMMIFPALFWFKLLRTGAWNATRMNTLKSVGCAALILLAVAFGGLGLVGSIMDIVNRYSEGEFGGPFSCNYHPLLASTNGS
jgi:hypothetical protein